MRTIILAALFPLILGFTATAFAGLPSLVRVKQNARAANGMCLPTFPNDQTPDQILRRNRIDASYANGSELDPKIKKALAHVISTMEDLGGGRFKSHQGVVMNFRSDMGYSELHGNMSLSIRPGNENMIALHDKSHGGVCNKGMLAHEIAHYISIRDNQAIQREYERQINPPCYVTRYAGQNRIEEFAEVFAAFLTNPDLFKEKGQSCDKARRVIASMFREHPDHSLSCDSRSRSIVNTPSHKKVPGQQ